VPVIDYVDEQTGKSFAMHIQKWVAIIPDAYFTSTSQDWTGTVVALVQHRADWSGQCPSPPCPVPPPTAPVVISLVQ
jgi:hypothetical protein